MDNLARTAAMVLLTVVPIAAVIWWKRRLEPQELAAITEQQGVYGKRMRALHGEPKLSLWTMGLPLMLYDEFMLMDGVKVAYTEVRDIHINNGDSLYGGGPYQVQVRTTIPGHEFLYARVGDDSKVAQDMVVLISQCVRKQHFVEPDYLAEADAVAEE